LYFLAHPGSQTTRTFFDAYKIVTDGGPCCLITPHLNFENYETRNQDPQTYTGKEWHVQPNGSKNGQIGGLKFVLDVESFDYTYSGKESMGFRIEFSDHRDMAIIKQGGYSISSGICCSFCVFLHLLLNIRYDCKKQFSDLTRYSTDSYIDHQEKVLPVEIWVKNIKYNDNFILK
jgi:hypothetical protein